MRNLLFLAVLIWIIGVSVKALRADELGWLRDFEVASRQAQSAGKDLLILFTGHGWCAPCEVLARQVFQRQEFIQATSAEYVFLELDFNFGDSSEETQRKTTFMQLRSRFLAPAVPTIVLADAQALPYAYITGYDYDTGPNAIISKIDLSLKAKEKRDELMLEAKSQTGVSKAETLSNALSCISPLLGSIDERGDDPLLQFYGDTIVEILKLTGGQGAVANSYISLKKQRNAWIASEAVFEKLKEFNGVKDYAGAINFIDSVLPIQESNELRWRLEYARQVYLEWDKKNEEALENCRRLLKLKELTDERREHLLDREAYNLFRLDRVEEGLSSYDRRIAAAADAVKRLRLLSWKSQMVLGRDPVEQSISTWQAYRDAAPQGTDDRFEATALLARELRRANRHFDALQLVKELLGERREAWLLLDAAESYIALENTGEALNVIAEAEKQAETSKQSQRKSDRDQYSHLAGRIAALKEDLTPGSQAKRDRTKD